MRKKSSHKCSEPTTDSDWSDMSSDNKAGRHQVQSKAHVVSYKSKRHTESDQTSNSDSSESLSGSDLEQRRRTKSSTNKENPTKSEKESKNKRRKRLKPEQDKSSQKNFSDDDDNETRESSKYRKQRRLDESRINTQEHSSREESYHRRKWGDSPIRKRGSPEEGRRYQDNFRNRLDCYEKGNHQSPKEYSRDDDHHYRHSGERKERYRDAQNHDRRDQAKRSAAYRDRRESKRERGSRRRSRSSEIENVSQKDENWGATATVTKEEPNFGLSGKLTEFTNTYKGVVIKYNEPPEARKPRTRWRLYPFKGDNTLPMLHIHRQSAYLIGRDRMIADIPVDHPSCSKQHSVLQFRLVDHQRQDGVIGKKVKPYIIDLESTNGTYVNNKRIDPRRYVELMEKDVVKFGFSTREYVILHDKSKGELSDEEQEKSGEAEKES